MSSSAESRTRPRIGFILYDNRSGSTLLSALLHRYRSIAVSPEVNEVAELLEALPRAKRRLQPSRAPEGSGRLDEQLRRLVDELCDPAGEITHQVVKGPRLHFHMATIAAAFPDCVFLQIVRDGRAVFASKRRTRSPAGGVMDDNLLHAAWNWRRKLEIAAAHGARLLTIRYEDLVREPDATITRTLDFLGVAPHLREPRGEIADFYHAKVPTSHRYLHSKLLGPLSPASIDDWRSQLSAHEVLLYEMKNAKALVKYGYLLDRQGRPQPAGVRLRAHTLGLTSVARWALRLVSTGFRYALTPRVLSREIRSKHGEAKARRSARFFDR